MRINEWFRTHQNLKVDGMEQVTPALCKVMEAKFPESNLPKAKREGKGPSCGQGWRQQPAPIRRYQLATPCSALSPKVRGANQAIVLASPTTTVFPDYAHTTGQTQFHPSRRENQTPRPRLHGLHHHPKQHILSLGTGARQDGCWQVRCHPEILPKSMPRCGRWMDGMSGPRRRHAVARR